MATNKKTKQYNYGSRRQMWQAYAHLKAALEYATACRAQAGKEDPRMFPVFDDMVTQIWVSMNRVKEASKKIFDKNIEELEVYK